MLQVVEQACRFSDDMSKGTVVIESDIVTNFPQAIEELGSTDARNMAIRWASERGCSSAGINGQTAGAYPINEEGFPLDEVRDADGQSVPPQHPRMQIARYRIAIPISRKIL